jgi:regulatory protein
VPTVAAVQRRGRAVSVHFADGPPLHCDRDFPFARQAAAGQALEAPFLQRLREAAEQHAAQAAALRLLAQRPRSRAALATRLLGRGHARAAVAATLEQLRQQGYLDDAAFARDWVERRARAAPRAARLLRAELRAQGVPREIACASTARLDDAAGALALAQQRRAAFAGPRDLFERRVGAALLRRGFSAEVAWRALRRAWPAGAAALE